MPKRYPVGRFLNPDTPSGYRMAIPQHGIEESSWINCPVITTTSRHT
jgi:hypothetical protein